MIERKKITEQIDVSFDIDDLEGDIDAIQDTLINVKKLAIDLGYSNINLELDWGYEGIENAHVFGTRLESDKELQERLDQEEKKLQKREAQAKKKQQQTKEAQKEIDHDRQEYERLKKKFAET